MTSASEQTSASRQPGYYHVKYKSYDSWYIAYWDGLNWPYGLGGLICEIDERRIERPQMDTEPSRFDIVKAMADQLGVGQPDELSKAEDVQLLKQQRIHDMNRISDLETTLKARPDKLSTYFELVQARRELSKAQERNNRLELALADIATRARIGIIKKIAKEALSHD